MSDSEADELKAFVDRLVDLAIYAPIGLLYEYPDVLPRLVAKGKSQVQLARVLSQMAGRAAEPNVASGLTELGRAFGLAPRVPQPPAAEAQTSEEPEPTAAVAPDPGEPWPGYDSMTARDVVARLPHLDEATRAAVGDYEASNKQRSTVLRRV